MCLYIWFGENDFKKNINIYEYKYISEYKYICDCKYINRSYSMTDITVHMPAEHSISKLQTVLEV